MFQLLKRVHFEPNSIAVFLCLLISEVNLDPAKILSIIGAFDVRKAHGWDNVSVFMVKTCDESLLKLLLIFSNFPLGQDTL